MIVFRRSDADISAAPYAPELFKNIIFPLGIDPDILNQRRKGSQSHADMRTQGITVISAVKNLSVSLQQGNLRETGSDTPGGRNGKSSDSRSAFQIFFLNQRLDAELNRAACDTELFCEFLVRRQTHRLAEILIDHIHHIPAHSHAGTVAFISVCRNHIFLILISIPFGMLL